MYPAIGYDPASPRITDQQAQRETLPCAARHRAEQARTQLTEHYAWSEALFASGLQRSDTPDADTVAEAISATMRHVGTGGCASRMAQEFGDHPEAAAERMRWVHSLLGLTPS